MTTRILITGKLHPVAIDGIRENPQYELIYKPDCSREELESLIQDVQVLVTRSETKVDRSLMDMGKELKVVARAAVGVGNIDLDAATEKGILVMNTPGMNTNSAAELSLGLMLAMLRHIPEAYAKMKSGGWDRHHFTGNELRHKVIGIVGLGNVGHRMAKFCNGLDMKVLAFDPYISPDLFKRCQTVACRSLEEMAAQVDILAVHVPLNNETKGMMDANVLSKLKPGAFVLNTARGGIIEEQALLEALNDGRILGAGLDTFENEPKPMKELIDHERVWCTPHIGASTVEAQEAIGRSIVSQLEKFLEGGVVDFPVNLPEIGVIDRPVLKAYTVLAEKLGVIAGQLLNFNPARIEFHYRGDIAELDNSILRLGWLKGFVSQKVDGYVSYVNVTSHIDAMGLDVTEAADPDFSGFKSALKVNVFGGDGEVLNIGGVVFDEMYMRLSLLNDFYFEVEPAGTMLMFENIDTPGVIGRVGMALADHEINISSFSLSRNSKGGKAMSIACVDHDLPEELLTHLKSIKNVSSLHAVKL